MDDTAQVAEEAQQCLIVGLGNPGEQYRDTRHNLGFRVVARLAARWKTSLELLKCNALVGAQSGVLLVTPQTFMNRSGFSVRCLIESFGVDSPRILVVYDDVDLPLGRLRLRQRGGPGGHRGMESIVQNLRTDEIPRLRLGIALDEDAMATADLVEFVLERFTEEEEVVVEEMIERAADACESWLAEGTEATMNRFNG